MLLKKKTYTIIIFNFVKQDIFEWGQIDRPKIELPKNCPKKLI